MLTFCHLARKLDIQISQDWSHFKRSSWPINLNENFQHVYLLNSKLCPVKREHPQKPCFVMRVGLQRGKRKFYVAVT